MFLTAYRSVPSGNKSISMLPASLTVADNSDLGLGSDSKILANNSWN